MTTLQRYFLETPFHIDGTTLITGDDSKHISRVMRMDVGDKVIAVSNGNAYIATIFELLRTACQSVVKKVRYLQMRCPCM